MVYTWRRRGEAHGGLLVYTVGLCRYKMDEKPSLLFLFICVYIYTYYTQPWLHATTSYPQTTYTWPPAHTWNPFCPHSANALHFLTSSNSSGYLCLHFFSNKVSYYVYTLYLLCILYTILYTNFMRRLTNNVTAMHICTYNWDRDRRLHSAMCSLSALLITAVVWYILIPLVGKTRCKVILYAFFF